MASMHKYVKSLIVLISFGSIAGQHCMNLETNGYTVPQGDIIFAYGNDLSITCNLHEKVIDEYGANASARLFFKRNNETIPKEMVTIINSSSASLHIKNHPKTKDDNYYCYFAGNGSLQMICMNVVYVGEAPQNVTDFSCLSRNYENLTCTWTAPQNYVKTDYSLIYSINSRSSRKFGAKRTCESLFDEDDGFTYLCPKIVDLGNGRKSCFWDINTKPQYRPVHECYYFTMVMNNTFGATNNSFTFEHFARVLPNPPENFTAVATSPHSINLSWAIPSSMNTFIPGLDHRILYQCEYYEKIWQFGGLIHHVKNKTLSFELKGLKYAHALCDIRVSMRSSVADKNDESMWSENATKTIRTESKRPDGPPKTIIGGFQSVQVAGGNSYTSDDSDLYEIYVYWHQLSEEQHNGQNFTYVLEVENHPHLKPTDDHPKTFAKFVNMSASNYVINIWSVNEKGRSLEKSTVFVPKKRLNEPSNFIKVAHGNNSYELSWDPPKHSESIVTNYTIFWCSSDRDRPYSCTGNMNWVIVPPTVKKHTLNLYGGIYQFAISANSRDSTSGMYFAECTIVPNRGLGKIGTVWINNVESTYMEVAWSLDCLNRLNTIQGYIIFYCQIHSPRNTSCKNGTEKNVTIEGGVNVGSGLVRGLKPYTIYRLTVSYIIQNKTYSQSSDPLYNTTKEDKPDTPPLNVEVYNITNSSVSVKWEPPINMNGALRDYNVYYNDIKLKVKGENHVTVPNLNSDETYAISVEACTVNCSNRSNPVLIKTKIGVPGEVYPEKKEKDSKIIINWDPPIPARGPINYYQIRVLQNRDDDDPHSYINVSALTYTLEGCASEKKPYYISVRAVNTIEGEDKAGPWSRDLETSCTPYTPLVYIIVGSMVIFIIAAGCGFKKLYQCFMNCKSIKNEQIILPPGLELSINSYSDEKSNDNDSNPPADVDRLLQKSDIRLSGDSSGCSSGHASITSSLESTVQHISASDSGTELPRSPSLGKERKNSVRLRNVSIPRSTANLGYVTTDTVPSANVLLKPPTSAAENYCVLGVDPSNAPKTDPPYVPITDLNTKLPLNLCDLRNPPPYVMTGDLVKHPNPGYVPYSITEPADKNMGYVVAGLPKDLLPPDLLQCDKPKTVSEEEKPLYVRASESIPMMKPQFPWQQPQPQLGLPKSGYVSVGDAPPPKPFTQVTKGYVPHRQFEGKSLKED